MMNNTRSRFFIIVIAVLLITNFVMLYVFSAQRRGAMHGPQGKGRSGMSIFLKEKVNFSDQQLARFDSLREKHHTELNPLFDSLKTAKRSYYALLSKGTDSDSLDQLVGQRQAAIERSFFAYFTQVRAMCDDQQKAMFDKEFPAMVERMITPGKWPGNRPGGDSAAKH